MFLKLKMQPLYDPTIPFLGIYMDKTTVHKDTCNPVLKPTQFTIAWIWKQHKHPLAEEWIKKMWHIYTTEYYSAMKHGETIISAAMWMDLEAVILNGVSQREREEIRYCFCVDSGKKMVQINLFRKQNRVHRLKNKSMVPSEGKGRNTDKLGDWNRHIHTTTYKTGN